MHHKICIAGSLVLSVFLSIGCHNETARNDSPAEAKSEALKFGHTLAERQAIVREAMDNQEREDAIISAKYHVGEGKKQTRATYDNYLAEFNRICDADEVKIAAKHGVSKAQLDSMKDETLVEGWHK